MNSNFTINYSDIFNYEYYCRASLVLFFIQFDLNVLINKYIFFFYIIIVEYHHKPFKIKSFMVRSILFFSNAILSILYVLLCCISSVLIDYLKTNKNKYLKVNVKLGKRYYFVFLKYKNNVRKELFLL